MKACIACGVPKKLDDFYKHPGMVDGHLGRCKECQKSNSKENYRKNMDRRVVYECLREQRPSRKAKKALYQRNRRRLNPEKYHANGAVNNAVRDGRLYRQPCSMCGAPKAQAHHEDYLKPLDVDWLCRSCHLSKHGKRAWDKRILNGGVL
jgi:hypothetical protein